jgi:hypothetical protein
LVDAVSGAVEVIVPFCFDGGVVRIVVVGVSGVDGVVVVCLVLDEGVEPAVADQDVFEFDIDCAGDLLGVLLEEVFCF